MKIDISGHHVEITDSLRDYVNEKLDRVIRHFDQLIGVHVILEVEKQSQKAEATLLLKGNKIHADAVEADMYVAIDALASKLDRQVLKYKEKLKDHRGPKVAPPEE